MRPGNIVRISLRLTLLRLVRSDPMEQPEMVLPQTGGAILMRLLGLMAVPSLIASAATMSLVSRASCANHVEEPPCQLANQGNSPPTPRAHLLLILPAAFQSPGQPPSQAIQILPPSPLLHPPFPALSNTNPPLHLLTPILFFHLQLLLTLPLFPTHWLQMSKLHSTAHSPRLPLPITPINMMNFSLPH